ncbi:MAG: hypothetical protein O2987_04580 [Firmicutes bacterium]|nr:hypothetical protein [Bacillota bacterium]
MNDTLKKLQIKESMTVFYDDKLLMNFNKNDLYDAMLLYVDTKHMLKEKIDKHLALLKQDGLLWILLPKSNGNKLEIRRDSGFEYLGTLGYEPVRNISYNETLSALRFRHVSHIKKMTRKGSMRLSDMMGESHGK